MIFFYIFKKKYNESDCFLYSYWVRVCGTCTTSTSNLYPGTHTQQ